MDCIHSGRAVNAPERPFAESGNNLKCQKALLTHSLLSIQPTYKPNYEDLSALLDDFDLDYQLNLSRSYTNNASSSQTFILIRPGRTLRIVASGE
jgi:hypothetical protein